MSCISCGKTLELNARFCSDCGTPVAQPVEPRNCVSCGKKLEPNTRFCGDCGTQVSTAQRASAAPPLNSRPVVEQAPLMHDVPAATQAVTVIAKESRRNGCGTSLKISKNPRDSVTCYRNECMQDGLIKNAEIAAKENINSGIPLSVTPATLHRKLISLLSESPCMPLDVFEQIEVVREGHYCVPAYCFYCNATAAIIYNVLVEKQQTHYRLRESFGNIVGEDVTTTRDEVVPANSTAAVSTTIFASGNKKLALQIKALYECFDPKGLVDIEELNFPADVETYSYDLPYPVAFTEYVTPDIEQLLKKKAEEGIANQRAINLSLGGAKIDKDIVRVFLGLYHIVFKYNGKEYSVYLTGDGEKYIHEGMPEDLSRKDALAQKLQARELLSLDTGVYTFGFWACLVGAVVTYGISIVGAVVFWILRAKKKEEHEAQKTEAQKNIDAFKAQSSNAAQQFKAKKKAMRGIYEKLTGDASAFWPSKL